MDNRIILRMEADNVCGYCRVLLTCIDTLQRIVFVFVTLTRDDALKPKTHLSAVLVHLSTYRLQLYVSV